jgi:hypothetical protein
MSKDIGEPVNVINPGGHSYGDTKSVKVATGRVTKEIAKHGKINPASPVKADKAGKGGTKVGKYARPKTQPLSHTDDPRVNLMADKDTRTKAPRSRSKGKTAKRAPIMSKVRR